MGENKWVKLPIYHRAARPLALAMGMEGRFDNMLPMFYNLYMEDREKYAHIRVLRRTQKNLRIAAALAEKSGLELLDDLVNKELERLQKERSARAQSLQVPPVSE